MRASRRLAQAVAVAGAGALALAACTAGGPAPTTSSPSPTPTGPAPEDVVAVRTLAISGADVEARVHPLVRVGDLVVLTVDLVASKAPVGEEDVFLSSFFDDADPGAEGPTSLRLLDLEADLIWTPALDAERQVVGTRVDSWQSIELDRPLRLQTVYAAPGTDEVALLLSGADLVDGIPVVDGDVPPPDAPLDGGTDPTGTPSPSGSSSSTPTPSESGLPPLDLDAVVTAEVHALEAFTHRIDTEVKTAETTDRVVIALGSDVLFASESADLAPESQPVVAAAVEQLRERGAGTVRVVGHTDSVADPASNQGLSERRAAAVAAALAPLLDPATHTLETSGEGERTPVASNDTEEGRQANRRVELTLEAERTTDEVLASTAELPAAPEHTATGDEGFVVSDKWRVRAPSARIVDEHLVLTLEATNIAGDDGSGWGIGTLGGGSVTRGGVTSPLAWTLGGVMVLQGHTAVHPLDYPVPYIGDVIHMCACEINTKTQIATGQTARFTAVYPVIGTPETITIQDATSTNPKVSEWRLTDIPVEQG